MKKITTLCLLTCLTVTLNSTCMLRHISKSKPCFNSRLTSRRFYNAGTHEPTNTQLLAAIQQNNALLNKMYVEMKKHKKTRRLKALAQQERSNSIIIDDLSHDFRDKHHGAYSENK